MATTNGLSLYIGRNTLAIPIKAGDLKFGVFIDKQTVTPIILDGQLGAVGSSNNGDNTQKIEMNVPLYYKGVDVRLLIQRETSLADSSGLGGITIALKGFIGNGTTINVRYRDCRVVDGGMVEDKDGRFVPYTFEGIHIVPGV